MALVYLHRRMDTLEPFYIGISENKRRVNRKDSRNKYWKNIYKKYGFVSEIVIDNISWEDACNIEIFLILLYGRKDLKTGCLCNMTQGGEGAPGRILTEEHKIKIGLAQKAKFPNGNIENLKKAWQSNKGRTLSKEHRTKLGRAVLKYDLNNNLLKCYDTISDAARDNNIHVTKIYRVCRGLRKTTGGYKWKYKNNECKI